MNRQLCSSLVHTTLGGGKRGGSGGGVRGGNSRARTHTVEIAMAKAAPGQGQWWERVWQHQKEVLGLGLA